LGTSAKEFEDYLAANGKMVVQSEELLAAAIERVKSWKPDFLLVPGDLTKDGEKQSHLLMAGHLAEVRRSGIKVFVIPGNHDVLNPSAYRYDAGSAQHVPSVSADEFSAIYAECGYSEALFRDPSSLSYMAEPVPGLWLLALDSCRYNENKRSGYPVSGGSFTAGELRWIRQMLSLAAARGKSVIVMMHHGVVEHFPGQARYFGNYVVRNFAQVSRLFAESGAPIVFTGHFHSQDVAERKWDDGRFLFDVETGSLIAYPDPLRMVNISQDQRMTVHSFFISALPSFTAAGKAFSEYAERFLREDSTRIAAQMLVKLGVRASDATGLSAQLADAYMANRRGDPRFTGSDMLDTKGLGIMGSLAASVMKDMVAGLWNADGPSDNDVSIDLSKGGWMPLAPEEASK
jgi:UDP-2,3-diacylglucosamine pyrophosphatase LpxH